MPVIVVQEIPLRDGETAKQAILRIRQLIKAQGGKLIGPLKMSCSIHNSKNEEHSKDLLFRFKDLSNFIELVPVFQRGERRSARVTLDQAEENFDDPLREVISRGLVYELPGFSIRVMVSYFDDVLIPIIETQCNTTSIPMECATLISELLLNILGPDLQSLPVGIDRDIMCEYFKMDTYCQYSAIYTNVLKNRNISLLQDISARIKILPLWFRRIYNEEVEEPQLVED